MPYGFDFIYSDIFFTSAKTAGAPLLQDQWAVTAHRWVTADDLLTPGNYDKYLRLNARIARESGLL